MADRALSTSRRALLGAAAALPLLAVGDGTGNSSIDSTLWNDRLARYTRLFARAQAAADTGWFRAANDRYERESGEGARRKAAFARVRRAEELYWRRCTVPMQQAAVALVLTPVPDLVALRQKLVVVRTQQLHEEGSMDRDCLEVLEGDVARLVRQ